MTSLSPNVYKLHPKSMENLCDFMMLCALHIYTTYSTEQIGFFLFTTMYAIYINWKSRYNHRHLATLYRYREAKY